MVQNKKEGNPHILSCKTPVVVPHICVTPDKKLWNHNNFTTYFLLHSKYTNNRNHTKQYLKDEPFDFVKPLVLCNSFRQKRSQ